MLTYRLTAFIEPIVDARCGSSVRIEESIGNHSPEIESSTGTLLSTTLIYTSTIIPSVADGLQGAVEGRERRQQTDVVAIVIALESVVDRNMEGVAIAGNTEDNLVGRHACASPCLYGVDGTAALVSCWRTSVIQRSVGGDSG